METTNNQIVCAKCGGTNVQCEAWIKPNTKEFIDYSDDSLSYAFCADCQADVNIIDVNKNKQIIENLYKKYLNERKMQPGEAICNIVFKDTPKELLQVEIKLSLDVVEKQDDDIFFYCNGIGELKSLCGYGVQDFVIAQILNFY